MAASDLGIISAATIDPELLKALKSAVPEQAGDDLVLRLPDGRIYFIDGFFAASETGDGLPPISGAIELAADIAALLLGDTDIATAAGAGEEPPPSSGTGFTTFETASGLLAVTSDANATSDQPTASNTLSPEPDPVPDRSRRLDNDADAADASAGTAGPSGAASLFSRISSGFLGNSGYGGPLDFSAGAVSLAAGPASGGGNRPREIVGGSVYNDGGMIPGDGPSFGGWSLTQLVTADSLLAQPVSSSFAGLAELADLADPAHFLHLDVTTVAAAGGTVTITDTSKVIILDDSQNWSSKGADPNDPAMTVYEATFNNATLTLRLPIAILQPLDWTLELRQSIDAWSNRANLLISDPDYQGVLRNDIALSPATDPSVVFASNDVIFGSAGDDILFGFAGDDILAGYGGSNILSGGDGDDVIYAQQPDSFGTADHTLSGITFESSFGEIDGGAGRDTLKVSVIDGNAPIDFRLFQGALQSIEVLSAAFVQGPDPTPVYVFGGHNNVVEFGYFDVPIIVLDAATIASMGGSLTLDFDKGIALLADAAQWTQVSDDATYVHYQADFNGQLVDLAIARTMALPIGLTLAGDADDNLFSLFGRSFEHIDGGAGDDIVSGAPRFMIEGQPGLDYSLGTLDYSDPANQPFSNIEAFVLAGCDEIRLSAAAILAMTDTRKTLLVDTDGLITLVDADQWHVDGYVSTTDSTGTVSTVVKYTSTSGAALLVSSDMLPLVADQDGLQFWHIQHDGTVTNFPVATALEAIDLGNGYNNLLTLTAERAVAFAGADGALDIVGDRTNNTTIYHDRVAFSDPDNWRLAGVERGSDTDFYLFHGIDQYGHGVDLRIATYLEEPGLVPQGTSGDDILRVADILPGGIDGGAGFDVLQLLASGGLDLTAGGASTPRDIEVLDMRNGQVSSAFLDAESVGRMASGETLYVIGEHSGGLADAVYLKDGANWHDAGLQIGENGDPDFRIYQANTVVDGNSLTVTLAVESELLVVTG